jgi:hypothetical protein
VVDELKLMSFDDRGVRSTRPRSDERPFIVDITGGCLRKPHVYRTSCTRQVDVRRPKGGAKSRILTLRVARTRNATSGTPAWTSSLVPPKTVA